MRDPTLTVADQQSSGVEDRWTTTRQEQIAVSNGRRRDALRCLRRFRYPVELRTLARLTVATRDDLAVDAVEADAIRRMTIQLHHLDIPILSAAGLLTYDAESQLVVHTAIDVTDRYVNETVSIPRQFSAL